MIKFRKNLIVPVFFYYHFVEIRNFFFRISVETHVSRFEPKIAFVCGSIALKLLEITAYHSVSRNRPAESARAFRDTQENAATVVGLQPCETGASSLPDFPERSVFPGNAHSSLRADFALLPKV